MKLFKSLLAKILPGKEIKEPTPANEAPAPAPAPAPEKTEPETPNPEPVLENPEPIIEGALPEAELKTPEPDPEPVDVEALMAEKAANHPEDLDWKRSIVDLMKLCDMDSSYANRKELAIELGYPEADIESKGSAEMNMWLHKQVIKGIAENGGKVPADMLD
jgi:hypothetical protein